MGGNRSLWTAGQAFVVDDINNLATNAAAEDDIINSALFAPSVSVAKVIAPLSVTGYMAVPGGGGNSGTCVIEPAWWSAVVSGSTVLSLAQTQTANSASHPSNASGSSRYDLVYASFARGVITTSSRKVKSVTDGSISTQTLNLVDTPLLTFSIASSTVSVADAVTKLPADGGGSYNFAVAVVTIPNGYSSGGAFAQSTITQVWSGGFIRTSLVRGYHPMSIFTSAITEAPQTLGTLGGSLVGKIALDRWGSDNRWLGCFRHMSADTIVLDNTINWQNRVISGSIARPATDGGLYKSAELVVVAGGSAVSLAKGFTGTNGGTATSGTLPSGGTFSLLVDATSGALKATFSGTPTDGTNGDNYVLTIEATDRFVF